MTRAEDRLFLTAANYYGEAKREKKISPFVLEALGDKAVRQPGSQTDNQQLSILDWQKPAEMKEKTSVQSLTPITYLSFSQIDTFQKCPRQYRFKYIQRIPVPPGAAAGFGSSMHNTLRDFYLAVKAGKKPTKKELFNLLMANWVAEGYSSKAHESRMKRQGKRILADFFDQAFDPKHVPKELEQTFVVRVSPRLKVGGRIDRVDKSQESLEIIDYKTGRLMDQKDVDKSLQMTVYAMAAVDEGIHGMNPENVTLTFYFLDSGEKRSTKRTASQLAKAKKEIVQKAKEISESDFKPKPGIWCEFCDFRLLCEAWA
jgi:DNA helicase-2/ATP-dependent DNA helicase PcrA